MKHRLVAAVTVVLLFGLISRGAPAFASTTTGLTRLTGHVLLALGRATKLPAGAAASSGDQTLTLALTLNRTDQRGFETFLDEIQSPASPNYQRYLTQKQLADRFGPSQSAYDQVLRWLQGQGFTLVQGSANRLTLTVTGTRAQAEQAFAVTVGDYQIGSRTFYANDRDPVLPTTIAKSVQAVVGLTNLAQPSRPMIAAGVCLNLKAPNLKYPFNGFNSLIIGVEQSYCRLALTLLRLAYNSACMLDFGVYGKYIQPRCPVLPLGPNAMPARSASAAPSVRTAGAGVDDGSGQKIGLLEFDNFHLSDIADYLDLFQAPPSLLSHVTQVHVNGGAGLPGADESEVLLDIDATLSLLPSANIVVYDAPFSGAGTSFQTLFNAMIGDGDTVISNSWSYCEDQTTLADVQSIDSVLANGAAAGVSVLNGSGDHGSVCLDGSPNTIGVPADSPNATAVGGTTLLTGAQATYGTERWWDGSAATPATGQGGFGVSRFFPRPGYQSGVHAGTMRSIPDVSASADPATGIAICQADAGGCPNGRLYGGTSVAAPEWAAFAALLGQSQGHRLGNLNPLFYPLAASGAFHTAASMNSDFAHVGLGSPNLTALRRALAGTAAGPVSSTVSTVSAFPPVAIADGVDAVTVVITLVDASGNSISGKTVSLQANGGSHAHVSPANGPSSVDNGAVVFTVTDGTIETVTFAATDVTDDIQLPQRPSVDFVSPPAAAGGISASPTNVPPDGSSQTTITVTLQDGQGHGVSGKTVMLAQGGGHSTITGPSPVTTDVNGQVTFRATDTTSETVNYAATDVTDGNLPVPGVATVTFMSGSGCSLGLGTATSGYAVSNFVTGFPLDVPNSGCTGPVGQAFDGSGNEYIVSPVNDTLYKFNAQGGTFGPANAIATLSQQNSGNGVCTGTNANGNTFGLAFGKDGRLYATQGGGFEGQCGRVVELDPATGAVLRTVAAYGGFGTTDCALGIATDPLSGDLFISEPACTFLGGEPYINRIANPASASPTLSHYAQPGGVDGLTFGPDGTLYGAQGSNIIAVSGTNQPQPATVTVIVNVPTADGVALQPNPENPPKPFLLVNRNDGKITKVDQSGATPTLTDIYSGGSRGDFVAVGNDGCLYATQTDRIIKLTNADGTCSLASTNPQPQLSLTPAAAGSHPQGTSVTFTAALINVANPAGTAVTFVVTGTNPGLKLIHADSSGRATFTYSGVLTGADTVTAVASPGGTALTSNGALVTWVPGPHTTFSTLNPSVTAGTRNQLVTVTGNLSDLSANPAAALGGQSLTFILSGAQGQTCTATTNNTGNASCTLTPSVPAGSYTLTVNFAGANQLLPSGDRTGFVVASFSAQTATTLSYSGDTVLFSGATAHLAAVLKDSGNNPLSGKSVSFSLGSDAGAQTCSGTTDNTGTASCTIPSVNQPLGPATVTVSFVGDSSFLASSTMAQVAVSTDTTPPTTTASTAPPPNAAGWNTSPVTVTLTASDANPGSGVATTYYAIDLASCTPQATATCSTYSAPFSLATDGRHMVTYFSKDNAGNLEAAHSLAVKLDQTAPVTTLSKASNSTDCAAQVTLTATDATAGVDYLEYQLDGGAWTRYRGPVVVFNSHTLTYRAHDVAGNVEATHSFTVPKSSRSRCPSPFG